MSYVYIVTAKVPYSDGRHVIKAFMSSDKAWAFIKEDNNQKYFYDFDVSSCELDMDGYTDV